MKRILLDIAALAALLNRKPEETVLVIGQAAVDAIGLPLEDLEREARAFGADRLIVAEPTLPTITYADLGERHNEPWRRKNRRHRR